jgi:hypothetical protein
MRRRADGLMLGRRVVAGQSPYRAPRRLGALASSLFCTSDIAYDFRSNNSLRLLWMSHRFASPLIIIAYAAILALPCLLVGIPSNGGDSFTHVMYQYHFSHQFWAGELYPRWLPEANKGYGSPMFFFQYPLPYYVTALLRPVLAFGSTDVREGRELGVFCFLALAGSGLSAWVWFRRRCAPTACAIAALAYMSLPYLIGQTLYTRAAIGELATFTWMPLILSFCDYEYEARIEILCAIGLCFALLILSNVIYATMFAPVVVLYATAVAKGRASATLAIALALTLGICVSGVYLIPFLDYRRFLDLTAMARYHHLAELGRNLLYFTLGEKQSGLIVSLMLAWALCLTLFVAWHIWRLQQAVALRLSLLFVLGLGVVLFVPWTGPVLIELSRLKVSGFDSYEAYSLKMLITALLTLAVGLLSYCRILRSRVDPREHALLAIACAAFVLMLPWSAALWSAIPMMSVIQYPWRLCSILSVATSGLLAMALDDSIRNCIRNQRAPSLARIILFTAVVLLGGNAIWRLDMVLRVPATPKVDATRWVEFPFATFVYPPAVSNFAAYVGTSPYTYDVVPTPVQNGVSAQCEGGGGSASVVRVNFRQFLVSARCTENAQIKVGQLYFPLWTIESVTSSDTSPTLHSSMDGLIEVSSSSGRNDFEIVLTGFAETAGLAMSTFSIAIVLAGFAWAAARRWRRPRHSR